MFIAFSKLIISPLRECMTVRLSLHRMLSLFTENVERNELFREICRGHGICLKAQACYPSLSPQYLRGNLEMSRILARLLILPLRVSSPLQESSRYPRPFLQYAISIDSLCRPLRYLRCSLGTSGQA
jgi:hypothetical protein